MEIKVVNLEETQRLLESLPDKGNKAIRVAIKQGLADIKEHASKNHRFTTRGGMLVKSIFHEFNPQKLQGRVFLDSAVAPYALYVHEGTKPHEIRVKNWRALRWENNGDVIFAKRVKHPGTRPDRFLYEAADEVRPRIQQYLSEEIAKAVRQ